MIEKFENYLRVANKYFNFPSFILNNGRIELKGFLRDVRIFVEDILDEDIINAEETLKKHYEELSDQIEEMEMWSLCEIDEYEISWNMEALTK